MLDDLFDLAELGDVLDALDLGVPEAIAELLVDLGILDGDLADAADLTNLGIANLEFAITADLPEPLANAPEVFLPSGPAVELTNPFIDDGFGLGESRDDELARLSVSVGVDLPF